MTAAKKYVVRMCRPDSSGFLDSAPIEGRQQAEKCADEARAIGAWAVIMAAPEAKVQRRRSVLKLAPTQNELDTLMAFIDGAMDLNDVGQALEVKAGKGSMQQAQYRLARVAMRAIASGVYVRRVT